jgi:hypothetical protein
MTTYDDLYDQVGGTAPGTPIRPLLGHNDEASAYVHGRARYWIERRAGWGVRVCQQTLRSMKVRRYEYEAAIAMFVDAYGSLRWASLPRRSSAPRIESFVRRFAPAMDNGDFASAIAFAWAYSSVPLASAKVAPPSSASP